MDGILNAKWRKWCKKGVLLIPFALASLLAVLTAIAAAGDTTRVSLSTSGVQGDSLSHTPAISADGRYVAFESEATNLVPGDTNFSSDVFVHDRQTEATQRVSVTTSGTQGNSDSERPAISADGRYVAFDSLASNLVPGDTNGDRDIFVHDRLTGATQRVSLDSIGNMGNADSFYPDISADGRYVAFQSNAINLVPSDTNGFADVFVHDRLTGSTQRVSVDGSANQGNSSSFEPSISADGRYVAFYSLASNLVTGDTNSTSDVFVHDRLTAATQRVSVDSAGNQGNLNSALPAISADGRYVAFFSLASNLVPGDTNGLNDVFVHDRLTAATQRVSLNSSGTQANGSSFQPSIGADGRYVAFKSNATNLVSDDTNAASDVFVHDRQTGATQRVSLNSFANQGNDGSELPAISGDGVFVAFYSLASNLVPGDTNSTGDVFVHEIAWAPPPTPTPTPPPPTATPVPTATPTATPPPPAPTPTRTPTPTPTPVPGVSWTGLVIMAGLLLGASFWTYRRRRERPGASHQ